MAVAVKVTIKGRPKKPRPLHVLGPAHMAAIGEVIAVPLRANLAAGLDADGNALAPESGRGDGIPGHETGALAASIKARRTKGGKLLVAPDYKRFPYGIYLTVGVKGNRGQPPRPFMGMASRTVDKVADANEATFKAWVDGMEPRLSAIQPARSALGPAPGALR